MAIAVDSSVTQTPGEQSLSTLASAVANYVGASSSSEVLSMVEQAVGDGVNRLNTRTWLYNMLTFNVSLAVDQFDYNIPANFKKPRRADRLNSSNQVEGRLIWKDPKTFSDDHDNTTYTGTSSYYTVYSHYQYGTMSLDVAPDESMVASYPTIRLLYHARIDKPSGAGDVVGVPPEFYHFLEWYAKWHLSANRGNRTQMQQAERMWRDAFQSLLADDNDVDTDF